MSRGLALCIYAGLLYAMLGHAMAESRLQQVIEVDRPQIKVIDGDSMHVIYHGQLLKLRLQGIDAPESTQAFAKASAAHLSQCLSAATKIHLLWQIKDRYGRILAKVLADQRDCNLAQIQQGFAWFYRNYQYQLSPADRQLYRQAEQDSRQKRRGLWQAACPIAPWDWRRQIQRCCTITAKAPSC